MLKGIIFDFDGLILDTESSEFETWQDIFAEYGQQLPLSLWQKYVGIIDAFDPFDYLEEKLGNQVERAALSAKRIQADQQIIAQKSALPGVMERINEARRLGLLLAVASSSPHRWVDGHLARLGLTDYFAAICCSDDVGGRSKPDPAVYQLALSKLGIKGGETIALEDSAHGVTAAKDAGIFTIAIPNQITANLNFDHADMRLNALTELSIERLAGQLFQSPISDY